MLSNVCAAANRRKERPVREFVLAVQDPKATFKSMGKCPDEFTTLDRKLGTALGKLFSGELGRRVDTFEQRALREKKTLLTGRQKLWLMYEHFRTDESMARAYTIQDLLTVKWRGDDHLEALRNDWEDKVAGWLAS